MKPRFASVIVLLFLIAEGPLLTMGGGYVGQPGALTPEPPFAAANFRARLVGDARSAGTAALQSPKGPLAPHQMAAASGGRGFSMNNNAFGNPNDSAALAQPSSGGAAGGGGDPVRAALSEVHLLETLCPPGPIGLQLVDGQHGPVIGAVAPASPLHDSVAEGDIIVSVDGVLSTGMLAVHVGGLLNGHVGQSRRIVIFPASMRPCPRLRMRVVLPAELQLKKPDGTVAALGGVAVGGSSSPASQVDTAPPPFPANGGRGGGLLSVGAGGASLMGGGGYQQGGLSSPPPGVVDCMGTPRYALLASGAEKVSLFSAENFHGSIVEFAQSSVFCKMMDFEPFAAQFRRIFECDVLFKPGMSCKELQQMIALEDQTVKSADVLERQTLVQAGVGAGAGKGLLPDAPRKGFYFYGFTIAIFLAVLIWVIIIVCLAIDCVEILLNLSDSRVKTDVVFRGITSPTGIPIYDFKYREGVLVGEGAGKEEGAGEVEHCHNDAVVYRGTMAQDLLRMNRSDAVLLSRAGTLVVDYGKIDVDMSRVKADGLVERCELADMLMAGSCPELYRSKAMAVVRAFSRAEDKQRNNK